MIAPLGPTVAPTCALMSVTTPFTGAVIVASSSRLRASSASANACSTDACAAWRSSSVAGALSQLHLGIGDGHRRLSGIDVGLRRRRALLAERCFGVGQVAQSLLDRGLVQRGRLGSRDGRILRLLEGALGGAHLVLVLCLVRIAQHLVELLSGGVEGSVGLLDGLRVGLTRRRRLVELGAGVGYALLECAGVVTRLRRLQRLESGVGGVEVGLRGLPRLGTRAGLELREFASALAWAASACSTCCCRSVRSSSASVSPW